jgi:hypothetical protein
VPDDTTFDNPEIHRYFGRTANNATWALLDADPRDDALVLDTVHASAYHWRSVGTAANHARADWMCSHVYAVIGWAAPARMYADRCMAACLEHGIGDFDLAYAHEAVARAAAAAGDLETARRERALALVAGEAIANEEDKRIFDGDIDTGPWYGADDPG